MAIAFPHAKKTFRLMFKYGWFFTDVKYAPKEVRAMLRNWMATSITSSGAGMSGDLVFEDSNGNSGKRSKYAWRMCSVFINKTSESFIDGKSIITSELVVGPYTSVCVPGDRFSYNEARNHALITLKESALKIYNDTPLGDELPALFYITMNGFTSYNRRARGNKR